MESTHNLKARFADQKWFRERQAEDNDYDGYVESLHQAWEAANQEAAQQITAGEDPTAIADSFRYALIRTSINSIAANHSPELVGQCVSLDLWTTRRALNLLAKMPPSREKVKAYVSLVVSGKLSQEEHQEALDCALAAAAGIEYGAARAEAIADLLPHLTGEQQIEAARQAAEALKGLHNFQADHRLRILSAIIPYLTDSQRPAAVKEALDALRSAQEADFLDSPRAKGLASLAPYLTGEWMQRGLQMASAMQGLPRVWALSRMLPFVPEEDRQRIFTQALDTAKSLPDLPDQFDRNPQSRALGALALVVRDTAEIEQVWDAIQNLFAEESRAWALAALVQHLEEDQRKVEAITLILQAYVPRPDDAWIYQPPPGPTTNFTTPPGHRWAFDRQSRRAQAIVAVASHLRDYELERGLDIALAIESESCRAWALSALAPHLPDFLLRDVLANAEKMRDPVTYAWLIAAINPYVKGQEKTQLLSQGLNTALALPGSSYFDNGRRSSVVSEFVPQLSSLHLQDALDNALMIEDYWPCAEALIVLAQQFEGEARIEAFEITLAVSARIKNEEERCWAFLRLGSTIPDVLVGHALDEINKMRVPKEQMRSLAALVARLQGSALADVVSRLADYVITSGDPDWVKAHVLEHTAPYLMGMQFEDALEAASRFAYPGNRSKALVPFLSYLQGERRLNLIASLMEQLPQMPEIDSFFDGPRAPALVRLFPHVDEATQQQLITDAMNLQNPNARGAALRGLLPYFSDYQLDVVLQRVLALPLRDNGVCRSPRADILAVLAGKFQGARRDMVVAEGIKSALAIGHEETSVDPLAAFAPYCQGETLQQGLRAAESLKEPQHRASVLAAFVPVVDDPEALLARVRHMLVDYLWSIKGEKREKVLRLCRDKRLLAPPVLPLEMGAEVVEYIGEIVLEWRWQ